MRELPDNSVDSIITDPPYHLTSTDGGKTGFMGKEWDGGDIAFRTEVWTEALRVLKPGGHLLAFGGSRTYHRLATAIETSGFEIRDQILWIYGSGFPKSHNIGKGVDKIQGNEREVVGSRKVLDMTGGNYKNSFGVSDKDYDFTKGQSDWEGWGTALKPAHEPIVMARKPLSEKTIVDNVLEWGTGGINIDESRIPLIPGEVVGGGQKATSIFGGDGGYEHDGFVENTDGRFPANVLLSEEAAENLDGHTGKLNKQGKCKTDDKSGWQNEYVGGNGVNPVERKLYLDDGGASKFFYVAKPSKKEKNEGLGDLELKERKSIGATYSGNQTSSKMGGNPDKPTELQKNTHPTIKPVKLMEYLCKLITRKEGVILDMFMGSGTTGIAAIKNGYSFIGVEREPEYMDIAKTRIDNENNKTR